MSQTSPPSRRSTRVKKLSLRAREAEATKQATMAPPVAPNTSKKRKATAPKASKAASTKPSPTETTSTKSRGAKRNRVEPKPTATASKAAKTTAPKSTKSTAAKSTKSAAPKTTRAPKRKATEDDDEVQEPPKKKAAPAPKVSATRPRPVINQAPDTIYKVFVFGEGSSGELGLGHKRVNGVYIKDVKRPRLNKYLSGEDVGVVQIAVGGMHCVALTRDNTILTWGVNDQGTLGRDSKSAELLKQIAEEDSDSEDDEDEEEQLNPLESRPFPISRDNIPEGTIFTSVAASDSCSFAVTNEGYVYGCGTFRNNEGILGFTTDTTIQTKFTLIPELKNIKQIACGANHAMALDAKGNVFAWGAGQQNQLGRRVVERTRMNGLIPREFGLPKNKIVTISAGSFHSFAIDKQGSVWSWGLNSFGQTGCADDLGQDAGVVLKPKKVAALEDKKVKQIDGGSQHSIAVTEDGNLLGFGRVDGDQLGIDASSLADDHVVKDGHGTVRIVSVPTTIPDVTRPAAFAAAGPDHNLVITGTGRAFSWGFSANYQTGQGSIDDLDTPTLIDNTAVREEKLVWAGTGGQFGVLTSVFQ